MIVEKLSKIITEIAKELGYEIDNMNVIKSNRPDLCDYQCDDVFKLAKMFKKNPMEIGESIVSRLNEIEEVFFKSLNKCVNNSFIESCPYPLPLLSASQWEHWKIHGSAGKPPARPSSGALNPEG